MGLATSVDVTLITTPPVTVLGEAAAVSSAKTTLWSPSVEDVLPNESRQGVIITLVDVGLVTTPPVAVLGESTCLKY